MTGYSNICSTSPHAKSAHARPPSHSRDSALTTFIRTSTLPDVLSQGLGSALPPPSDPTWPHVLAGSSDPPPLKPAKSHQPSSREARRYDIDAFIAEATSLQALRGLRFYYPKAVNNL
jgi:hypothetical protein